MAYIFTDFKHLLYKITLSEGLFKDLMIYFKKISLLLLLLK